MAAKRAHPGSGRVSIALNPGRLELAYPSGPRRQVPINGASLSRAVHADQGSPWQSGEVEAALLQLQPRSALSCFFSAPAPGKGSGPNK